MKKQVLKQIKKYKLEVLLFLVSLSLFVGLAYYLVFELQFLFGDALSRTFHAYAVFFGNNPKLASIGLVWPPVPTLVQLPFVLIKPLNVFGFAGNVVSSLFMASTVLVVYKSLLLLKLTKIEGFLLSVLFLVNPMILFYGANGMSEAIAIFFYSLSTYHLIQYLKKGKIPTIIAMSISVSLAVMSRWEMVLLIPILITSLGVHTFLKVRRNRLTRSEAYILIFATPVAFTILVWLIFNFTIMNDTFHFMKSIYSNSAQSASLIQSSNSFAQLKGNILMTTGYVLIRVFYAQLFFFPLSFLVALKAIVSKNKVLYGSLVATPLAIVCFHLLLLYKGQSFGWLRFFIYVIPSTYLLLALVLTDIKKQANRRLIFIISTILLIGSSLWTARAMSLPTIGREENKTINAILYQDKSFIANDTYEADVEVAQYILTQTKNRILVDDFTGFPIVYYTDKPSRFIETIDNDFDLALEDPYAFSDLDYFLVRKKEGVGDLDAINRKYPSMYENGAGIATLEKDFGVWRLYKLTK